MKSAVSGVAEKSVHDMGLTHQHSSDRDRFEVAGGRVGADPCGGEAIIPIPVSATRGGIAGWHNVPSWPDRSIRGNPTIGPNFSRRSPTSCFGSIWPVRHGGQ